MPKYKVADYRISSFDPGVKGVEPITSGPEGTEVPKDAEPAVLAAAKSVGRKLVKVEEEGEAAALTVPNEAGRGALLAAGYTSDTEVSDAPDEMLLAVDGVGLATLEKIRDYMKGSE